MSLSYLSAVSGLPTGLAGSTTVTAQATAGSGAPATAAGATAGTVFETSTPGTYICTVTYPSMAAGTVPWAHWSAGGLTIDDPAPTPLFAPVPAAEAGTPGGLMILGDNAGPVLYSGGWTISNLTGDALTLAAGDGSFSGLHAIGGGTGHGIETTGGASGGDGFHPAAGAGGVDIRANIAGNLSGSVASVTAPVAVDGTRAVPTTGNAANSVNDCLNAARAQGFGKWTWAAISPSTSRITLYAPDDATPVHSFTLNAPVPAAADTPTSRS